MPVENPLRVKQAFVAAALAEQAGKQSLDYLIKKEGEEWPIDPDFGDEGRYARTMLRRGLREVHRAIRWWTSVPEKDSPLGQFAAGAALLRLKITFQSAAFLIRFSCIHEGAVLLRLCLEQIGWAFAVHDAGQDSDKVFGVSATRGINAVKSVEESAGRWYGMLSRMTHIDEGWHKSFVRPLEGDMFIVHRDPQLRSELALMMLCIVDLYCVVTEYVYAPMVSGPRSITIDPDGRKHVVPGRPLQRALARYGRLYPQYATGSDGIDEAHIGS